MAALFTAKVEAATQHLIDHVLVADCSADDLPTSSLNDSLEPGVAHDCADDCSLREFALREKVQAGNRHDVVTIDQLPRFVREQDTVGVAIMGDAEIGAMLPDLLANHPRVH